MLGLGTSAHNLNVNPVFVCTCSGKGWCVCSVLTNDNSDVYETK